MMKKTLAYVFAALLALQPAYAQNAGTVTNHAFAIGKGAGVAGYTSLLCSAGQLAVGQATDPICRTVSGDWTLNAAGVAALATVNANVGTFGSATQSSQVALDAKGRVTSATSLTVTPTVGSITGLGAGCATWLGTPSSANLAGCLTDEVSAVGVAAKALFGTAGNLPATATNDSATAGNVGEQISVQAPYNAAGATVTMAVASPGVVTWTGHGLVNTPLDGNNGVPVFFQTTGSLLTGLVANTTYYAVPINANTFNVATTVANALAGTFINFTGAQSGTQTGFMGARDATGGGAATDIVGIPLTAGNWNVTAQVQVQPINGAAIQFVEAYASASSITRAPSPAGGAYFFEQQPMAAGTGMSTFVGTRLVRLSTPTVIYLGAFPSFTGGSALNLTGYLSGARIR